MTRTITFRQISIGVYIIALLTASVLTALSLSQRHHGSNDDVLISEKKTIALSKPDSLLTVKTGAEIAGTYKPVKDQALFYTLTNHDKALVGSGTIIPDANGHFSRNLALVSDMVKPGSSLALRIYTQTMKGDITDQLNFMTTYK